MEGLELVVDGLGFGEEVLLEGGEVGGEVFPEEGAGGEKGGLFFQFIEAGLDWIWNWSVWRADCGWGRPHRHKCSAVK